MLIGLLVRHVGGGSRYDRVGKTENRSICEEALLSFLISQNRVPEDALELSMDYKPAPVSGFQERHGRPANVFFARHFQEQREGFLIDGVLEVVLFPVT